MSRRRCVDAQTCIISRKIKSTRYLWCLCLYLCSFYSNYYKQNMSCGCIVGPLNQILPNVLSEVLCISWLVSKHFGSHEYDYPLLIHRSGNVSFKKEMFVSSKMVCYPVLLKDNCVSTRFSSKTPFCKRNWTSLVIETD